MKGLNSLFFSNMVRFEPRSKDRYSYYSLGNLKFLLWLQNGLQSFPMHLAYEKTKDVLKQGFFVTESFGIL